MRTRILIFAVLMASISGTESAAAQGAGGHAHAAPASPAPSAAMPGSWEWRTYQGEGGARRYRLFVPAGRDAGKPAPLVVMLHGCTQDPDDFARGTRFNQAAAEAGVIVAWPEQTGAHQPQKCWTWYDPAHQGRGGEAAIIAGIAREVIAAQNADPARVYVVGVSAGAAQAVNAAAAYPELFTAVGAHSGIAYRAAGNVMEGLGRMKTGSPTPDALVQPLKDALGGRAVPIVVIHGGADAVVAPQNGRQLFEQWAAAHGWTDAKNESITGDGGREIFHTWHQGADGKTLAELLWIEGLGHAWSGGSPDGTFTDPVGPDATRVILGFLLKHTR